MDIQHRVGAEGVTTEAAYQAVATRAGVAAWWIPGLTGDDDSVGGVMRFGEEWAIRFAELQPHERVAWVIDRGPDDWVGTTITFDLKQDGDFAIVLFGHRGWAEASEHMAHCSTKWAVFLLSLKQYLETGTGRPGGEVIPTDNW